MSSSKRTSLSTRTLFTRPGSRGVGSGKVADASVCWDMLLLCACLVKDDTSRCESTSGVQVILFWTLPLQLSLSLSLSPSCLSLSLPAAIQTCTYTKRADAWSGRGCSSGTERIIFDRVGLQCNAGLQGISTPVPEVTSLLHETPPKGTGVGWVGVG